MRLFRGDSQEKVGGILFRGGGDNFAWGRHSLKGVVDFTKVQRPEREISPGWEAGGIQCWGCLSQDQCSIRKADSEMRGPACRLIAEPV